MRGWWSRFLGDAGERAAVRYLRHQGFRILARQWRDRSGEIDLIARDGEWIVFIEVKTRRTLAAGHPVEAVTPAKQAQLTRLALHFLKRRGLLERRSRFDVVAVTWSGDARLPVIEHYRHAFTAAGEGRMFA